MKTSTIASLVSLGLLPLAFAQSTTSSLVAPTESYGCEVHDDHFHCEGHTSELVNGTPTGSAPTTTPDHDHEHDHDEEDHDHDHEETPASGLAPSPTASEGCEPHGDHWHCDGPRETGSEDAVTTDGTASTTPAAATDPAEAGVATHIVPVAGAIAAAIFAL